MPRMTNTYMLAGKRDPGEILASVKNGIYAANFAAARSTSPRANMCSSAPRLTESRTASSAAPLKGAMLIGNGPTDLHRITMIGNDLALDSGIGTCGKETARACRSASASRRCGWKELLSEEPA